MLEDYFDMDLESIIPMVFLYLIVGGMMFFLLWYKKGVGLRMGIIPTVLFYILLMPITYFIVTYFKNKD
jgi:hypothetical protein